MARDSSIPVAKALVATMRADADLIAIVPSARIFRQATGALPTFPFIRSGAPTSIPVLAACVDGGEYVVAIHGFAKDRMNGSQVVELAEDYAGRIGAAIAKALGGKRVGLDEGTARITWTGSQLLMDPDEAGCFHAVVNFRVRVIA